MATRFVASGGSNTAPYETWAKAATSLATALAASTATGDIIVLQYNAVPAADAEVSTDTTWTFAGNVALICASNDGGSAYTPTAMGTGTWVGNSTTNRSVTFAGSNFRIYIYGLTIRTAGSVSDKITVCSGSDADWKLEDCYLWNGNSNSGSNITIGQLTGGAGRSFFWLLGCTFRFGEVSQGLQAVGGYCLFEGCTFAPAGAVPTPLFDETGTTDVRTTIDLCGCDLSAIVGTLVDNTTGGTRRIMLRQCKLGSGVTLMAAQTTSTHKGACEVTVYDCAAGDEHYHFQHHNGMGSLTIDTSRYVTTDGAAYNTSGSKHSWKIVTTANASVYWPYISPWITVHHEGTGAITPYFEILRDGSATAFQNDEVWSEWLIKATTGFTLGTHNHSDRVSPGQTPANQTASSLGAGDWTGEGATVWFGKLSPTATVTPAEIGDLAGRIVVGEPSTTVYIDPQIRGRS